MASVLVNECFEEMKEFVFSLAYFFWRRYRGELEEIRSEALFHYVSACRSFDRKRGEFKKWVRTVVWGGLLDTKEQQARRAKQLGERVPIEELTEEVSPFNLSRFLSQLPSDARRVAALAIDPTPEALTDEEKKMSGNKIRCRLRAYLMQLGWSQERIINSFRAIATALEE